MRSGHPEGVGITEAAAVGITEAPHDGRQGPPPADETGGGLLCAGRGRYRGAANSFVGKWIRPPAADTLGRDLEGPFLILTAQAGEARDSRRSNHPQPRRGTPEPRRR